MVGAKKGDLVLIHKTILKPDERPDTLPACTKSVPYEGWVKGFLLNSQAPIGSEVQIETFIGREISGTLVSLYPAYDHTFGLPQEELLFIGRELRKK